MASKPNNNNIGIIKVTTNVWGQGKMVWPHHLEHLPTPYRKDLGQNIWHWIHLWEYKELLQMVRGKTISYSHHRPKYHWGPPPNTYFQATPILFLVMAPIEWQFNHGSAARYCQHWEGKGKWYGDQLSRVSSNYLLKVPWNVFPRNCCFDIIMLKMSENKKNYLLYLLELIN